MLAWVTKRGDGVVYGVYETVQLAVEDLPLTAGLVDSTLHPNRPTLFETEMRWTIECFKLKGAGDVKPK